MSATNRAAAHRRRDERPFSVEIGELRRTPGTRRHVHLEASLSDLAVSGSAVPEGAPISLDGVIESVHEGILLTGTVRAPWSGPCRRCLKEARGEVAVEVRELCVEHGDEETTYHLEGDQLDLEPIVHDACILELPLAPLCGEGCLGICPECGADRNVEPCSCAPAPDPRWAGLSVLTGGLAAGGAEPDGSGAGGSTEGRRSRR
ncbi:MAG: YceD family protein [Actinomycetota bacterium]|nr:YceD family protein [Actinomycetota bacterium]